MTLRQVSWGPLSRRILFSWTMFVILMVGLIACQSGAPAGPQIQADDAWSRPAVAMGEMGAGSDSESAGMGHAKAGTGAVYMRLVNSGREADRLTGAQTDVAETVEIHETKLEGDVMRMQMLPNGLEIPGEGEVLLKPGGYHVMLIGLTRDLNEGDRITVVLEFEQSGSISIEAEVRQP